MILKSLKFSLPVVIMIAVLSVLLHDQYRDSHPVEHIVHEIDHEFDLNEAQNRQLRHLVSRAMIAYDSKPAFNPETVKALLSKEVLDQAQMLAMIQAYTQHIDQIAPKLVADFAAFANSLEPEQREHMLDILDHVLEHHFDDGHKTGRD